MRIRKRILVLLSIVALLYTACVWAVQRWVIRPGFERLEIEQSERDARRAQQAIAGEIEHLDSFCLDWAAWDDTYDYCETRDAAYVEGNLTRAAFENGNFALAYLFDTQGRLIFGQYRDAAQDHAVVALATLPARDWPIDHPLLGGADPERGASGLFVGEEGAFLISSRPILTSQRTGPARGWLVMGLPLDPARVLALAAQTRVDFDVWPTASAALDVPSRAALEQIGRGTPYVTRAIDAERRAVYCTLDDLGGTPTLLLRMIGPREVSAQASSVLRFALASTCAAALLVTIAFLLLLQRAIISPISVLTDHVVAIGQRNDLSKQLKLERADEIGILSREFDAMVERLARSRAELLDAARAGGMSEVATGVLHNIGNVLNSAHVSAGVVSQRFESPLWRDLERALDLMRQHADDLGSFLTSDPKGKQLPSFLAALDRNLASERQELRGELGELRQGLEHVRELIHAQQDLARQTGVYEEVSVAEQIEAAWRITRARDKARSVEFELAADVERIQVHKHKLLQILVNLMRNAVDSIARNPQSRGRVGVRVARDGEEHARIEIQDDGAGIAPENLTRIFTYGFSTKRDGHGFGLHSCVLAAREMGGSLDAFSDGERRGARFVLRLPIHAPESAPLAL